MAHASLPVLAHAVVLAAFLYPCPGAQTRVANISAVEAALRDRAFWLLRRTSQLVDVSLLAAEGVEASALRVRSNALWADGVNATAAAGAVVFAVPPRVVPAPFARRVAIVFEAFVSDGGGSGTSTAGAALFAAPRGFVLAAPVVGLLAYDASEGTGPDGHVSLRTTGAPVRVEFRNAMKGFNATTARCVTFAASGDVVATHAVVPPGPACSVTGTGRFGVAVPAETPPPRPLAAVSARWWAWTLVVGAGGVLGASLLALAAACAVRWCRRRRREEMERRAMAEEELGRMTVRGSRMPSAKVTRTQPQVEEGSPLPWRGRPS